MPDDDRRLESANLAHSFRGPTASKQFGAGVCPVPTQAVAVLRAYDPHDRIRVPVRRSEDGRAASIRGGTPEHRKLRWRAGGNLQAYEIPTGAARAIDTPALKRNYRFITCREIGG